MEKKVTIKEQFVEVAEVLRGVERADLAEFIEGRIAVLDKKAANKKATAKQEENEILKGKIVDFLAENATERYVAGDLAKTFEVSIPKISALLTQLKTDGKIVREVEKKTAYFSVA